MGLLFQRSLPMAVGRFTPTPPIQPLHPLPKIPSTAFILLDAPVRRPTYPRRQSPSYPSSDRPRAVRSNDLIMNTY